MRTHELQCREVVEVLTDYLDGALPPADRVALEQHLLFCQPCAVFLEQLRASIALTGRIEEEDVPEEVLDRMSQMFREREDR
jgi:anti-sigma factor RsiW